MNTEVIQSSFHYSPRTYFKKALSLFETEDIPAALQSLDAAIIFSNNSPFYIHQKIRILYKLGALKSCSGLIISQLEYLYKNGSLYILCRTLDYLQLINHYSVGQLKTILNQNHIPYCLANHYKEWLTTKEKPFFDLAISAIHHDQYASCISYCELYLKYKGQNETILYELAYAHHMMGNVDTTKSVYHNYFNITSKKEQATAELACLLMEAGNYDSAADHLNNLLSADSKNQTYLSYLGECYYLANKLTSSMQIYELIAKYYPDDTQNLFNLSHIYTRLNKKWHAKRCLKHVEQQLKQNMHR